MALEKKRSTRKPKYRDKRLSQPLLPFWRSGKGYLEDHRDAENAEQRDLNPASYRHQAAGINSYTRPRDTEVASTLEPPNVAI